MASPSSRTAALARTKDIRLLIDASPENVGRVRQALQILEDRAVNDVQDDDVEKYSVVRVADEIVIDLMARACGVDYADAHRDAVVMSYDDVPLVVASLETPIRTKQTVRPSDVADRQFLQVLLDEQRRG